jgi:hypothetical protein
VASAHSHHGHHHGHHRHHHGLIWHLLHAR